MSLLACAALTVMLFRLAGIMRRDGVAPTLRRLFLGGGQQGRGGRLRSRAERHAEVAALVQALPVERYRTREELAGMSVAHLKALVRSSGVQAAAASCLEKHELVDTVLVSLHTVCGWR